MAETELTGRSIIMQLDAERDNIAALARRCAEQAIDELPRDDPHCAYDAAYAAAMIAIRETAKSIQGAQETLRTMGGILGAKPL